MSKMTSIKRIALVAVSALGFGLLSVVPAKAADSAPVLPQVTNQTMVRSDDATYLNAFSGSGTAFGLQSTEAAANDFLAAKILVTYRANSASSEIAISTVAGAAPAAAGSDIVNLGTGVRLEFDNGTAGTNTFGTPSAAGVYTIAGSAAASAANVIKLNLARNATPGLYTLYIDGNADGDYTDATGTDDVGSIMIADMPNTVRIRGAVSATTSATRVGNGTLTYNVQVRDAGGRDSYLLGTERVRFAVAGGSGSGLTLTTPSLPTIGSGDLATTSASRRFQIVATASSAAGTYTITGTMEGFASAWTTTSGTADAVIVSDASVTASGATRLGLVSTTGANSNATAYVAASAADTTTNAASTGTASDTAAEVIALNANIAVNYIPTTTRSITLEARFATTASGDARFTVVNGNVSGIYDGAAVRLAPIQSGPTYNFATITYTADYANADEFVLWSIAGAANVLELAVVYKNPTPGYIEVSDPAGANVRVASASSNNFLVTVLDQYGSAMPNTPVTFTTSAASRNASAAYTLVTNASGQATFTHADVYVGTDGRTTDAITVTAVNGASISSTINVVYGLATTGAMAMTVNQPTTPGTTATYDLAITTDVTKTVAVDDTPDSTNNADAQTRIADQLLYGLTLTTSAGSLIQGQPVVVTATEGVFFNACSNTVGEVSTTVTGKRTTRTCYSNSSGVINIQASFTKSGVATVTFTSGDVVKTHSILVTAGAARNLSLTTSGTTVTAKVTDLRGNPVSGHSVTITASGVGRFANGVAINTVNTSAAGEVSYDVFGTASGNTTITASMASSTETVKIADATWGLPAGNRTASADLTVGVSNAVSAAEAASDAAAEAIDAANAATDAANLAAEAADAATVAAEEARDAADAATAAVEALATEVATLMAALKAQITTLANTVAKIAKKVKA